MIPLTILFKLQREHQLDRQDVTKKKKKPFMGTTLGALSRSFNDPVVTVFGIMSFNKLVISGSHFTYHSFLLDLKSESIKQR